MKRSIITGIVMLLLAIPSVFAEDVHLRAAVPGDAGTVALTFILDDAAPAVMNNFSTVPPVPTAVPEPSPLVLLGLGVAGLVIRRKCLKKPARSCFQDV